MSDRHRALIIEDDRATVEDLALILDALGFEHASVDNKRDALAATEREAFCLVLLDLQIKSEPGSIKGHQEVGHSVLRELRRAHPEHANGCHQLPILVISGYAREADDAVEVMKEGADDVIQKPLSDNKRVSQSIRQCLEKSGRATHEACEALRVQTATTGALVLSIPGDRTARRTRVTIGGRAAELTDRSLRILLMLILGRIKGGPVHKVDLGSTADQGFKGVSVLAEELKPALPEGRRFFKNLYHGFYQLEDDVELGTINFDPLLSSKNDKIRELGAELGALLPERRKKV